MTSDQVRLFSTLASDSRNATYGQPAVLNGGPTITIVCQPLNNLELEAGGFEQQGIMKALVSGATIPVVHDRLLIDGNTWVVRSKIENSASVETGLMLEAVPV